MPLEEIQDAWIHHDFSDSDQIFNRKTYPQWTPLKQIFRKPNTPPMPSLTDQVAVPLLWKEFLNAWKAARIVLEPPTPPLPLAEENTEPALNPEVSLLPDATIEPAAPAAPELSNQAKALLDSIEVPDFTELNEWLKSLQHSEKKKPIKIEIQKVELAEEKPLPKPYYHVSRFSLLKNALLLLAALVALGSLAELLYLQFSSKKEESTISAPEQINPDAPLTPLRSPTKPNRE